MTFIPLRILGTGKALPRRTVFSSEIDAQQGFEPGYTAQKGGVTMRYFAQADETQSALGALALQSALRQAGLVPADVDLLICACAVPEQALPSTACAVAAASGLPEGTPAFDINASCLSFLSALQVAGGLLATASYRRIAIVSVDLPSRGLDWSEPESSLIFGDGAACAIVDAGLGQTGIEACLIETYPQGRAYCEVRAGGTRATLQAGCTDKDFLFSMDGKAVFKLASRLMPDFLDRLHRRVASQRAPRLVPNWLHRLFTKGGNGMDRIDTVVPHQASHLAMQHLRKRLGMRDEQVVDIYATHGNQVAASMPTALHVARTTGRAQPGNRLLLIGTGAGLTLGAMVLRV